LKPVWRNALISSFEAARIYRLCTTSSETVIAQKSVHTVAFVGLARRRRDGV
jgi:hypothetical protein